ALRRLGMMWNLREYPQVENDVEYEALAGPLGLPWLGTFACLGTLALAALPFAWRRSAAGRFTVGYALAITLGVLPFFVTDRYRHHLMPAAALLAAVVLEEIVRAFAARQPRTRLAAALAVAAAAAIVALPAPSMS